MSRIFRVGDSLSSDVCSIPSSVWLCECKACSLELGYAHL